MSDAICYCGCPASEHRSDQTCLHEQHIFIQASSAPNVSPPPKLPVKSDRVNHPDHYTWMPKGIEVIDITSNFSFTVGNALKYLMRAGRKGEELEDLKKALWYVQYEIKRIEEGR